VKKAIAQFESLYAEKTGNMWGTPSDEFVKHPTKFYPLEIDYGQVCSVLNLHRSNFMNV